MTPEERFWLKVDKTASCWNWNRALTPKGYGRINVGGVQLLAHRFAYQLLIGPIPDGLQVDHMCHNRMCVNPEHLRLATPAVNGQNRSGAQRTSKSGIRGVHQLRGRWRVQITVSGKRYSAGPFPTAEEAERAVKEMRRTLMPGSLRDHLV